MNIERWTTGVALVACALLASACVARATPGATATPGARAPIEATPRAGASNVLADSEAQALLRRAVCWLDDPARARSCLPPNADAIDAIGALGRSGDARMIWPLVDLLWVDVGWRAEVSAALTRLTGEALPSAPGAAGPDARAWSTFAATRWRASAPPGYAAWKAGLLALTATGEQSPTFAQLFEPLRAGSDADVLAQLVWTGVQPNASRPLTDPPHVERERQLYLADGDVVYGVVVGEEARAYPERIVAWHGVVHDTLGETPIVVAHCLLCGSVAVFDRRTADGGERRFGTTGLALRGRMLLFEEGTLALWDAMSGARVAPGGGAQTAIGRAVPIFVTSWADWAARHPETTVLTLDTGVVRDYASGAALRDELATREPRYTALTGGALPPKEPVLGVGVGNEARAYPLALLARRRMVQEQVAGRGVLVLQEGAGLAAAAYDVRALRFTGVEGSGRDFFAIDERGERWAMREHALVHTIHGGELPALPRQQSYWFAWRALHPQSTVLE